MALKDMEAYEHNSPRNFWRVSDFPWFSPAAERLEVGSGGRAMMVGQHLRKFGLQTLLTGQPVAAFSAGYGYSDSPKGLPSQGINTCEPRFRGFRFGWTCCFHEGLVDGHPA